MSSSNGGLVILTEMMSQLPPSEKKLAAYIIDHPEEAIRLTANELGKRSLTSSAAVIRLCKSLNLTGFQEFKIRIAGDLQNKSEQGYRDIKPNETTLSIIDKMTTNSVNTIHETADLLSIEAVDEAVKVLRQARRIHFIGVGASGIIAQDAQHKFSRINTVAYAFSDMHLAATLVANGSEEDVVVGISFSGQTEEVTKILKLAREKGVHTVSVTKYGNSPVTEQAGINLYTSATYEPTFRSGATSSRMAQLQVIDILFMCVASAQYDDTVKYIDSTREAVKFLT